MSRIFYTFWIISITIFTTTECLKWLALGSVSSLSTGSIDICDTMPGLERRQRKVCRRHIDVMASVTKGANISISECQYQFGKRRWNCSMVDHATIFGNIINQGTREAAYVHAIAAAGVSYSVTESCSQGQLAGCGCDRSRKGDAGTFRWSGCSDNIAFGTAFSKRFTDARERLRKSNGRSLMNLHNNEAGRQMVENHMQTECKCHGVSGSCELKTCWRALPSFRQVGSLLRESFDGATEVKARQTESSRLQLLPANRKYKPFTVSDLVYLKASPDFCESDEGLGSLGTHGRECNATSNAIDGCDLMCCGRGYHTVVQTVVERCDCKFHWCCFVNCKECERKVEKHICL